MLAPPAPLLRPTLVVDDDRSAVQLPTDPSGYARVVVVERRGPTLPAADCRSGKVLLDRAIDANQAGRDLVFEPNGSHSLRVCAFRNGHPEQPAATATRAGRRHSPWLMAQGRGCEATLRLPAYGELDADAVAVEIMGLRSDEPVDTEQVCARGQPLARVPATQLADLAELADDSDRVSLAIDLHQERIGCELGRDVAACLRLEDGSLVAGADASPQRLETASERHAQRIATPLGDVAIRSAAIGHLLVGHDVDTNQPQLVQMLADTPVRYSSDRRVVFQSGRVVLFGAEERVWVDSRRRFVRARELAEGDGLLHRSGRVDRIARRPDEQPADRFGTFAIDVTAPNTFYRDGYLVADDKPSPRTKAHVVAGSVDRGVTLTPHPESFDCRLGVRLSLLRLANDVERLSLQVRAPSTPPGQRPALSCDGTASLSLAGPGLRRLLAARRQHAPTLDLDLELEGDDESSCSAPSDVVLCEHRPGQAPRALAATSAISGPTCLAEGTPVDTPRGPVAIERLTPGSRVLAFDEDSGEVVTATVRHVRRRLDARVARLLLSDGQVLRATREHPFFLPQEDRYDQADTLVIGDALLGRAGVVTIAEVSAFDEPATVFDVSVTHPNNFFAAGVLVHNY
jgi:Pretoxin HINT domain